MNNREVLVDWFLAYNRENLKSVTKSLDIMSEKFGMSKAEIRKILGRDVFELTKVNPSKSQKEILELYKVGKSWVEISRELNISRQAVNIVRRVLVAKNIINKVDDEHRDYQLSEGYIQSR